MLIRQQIQVLQMPSYRKVYRRMLQQLLPKFKRKNCFKKTESCFTFEKKLTAPSTSPGDKAEWNAITLSVKKNIICKMLFANGQI